MKTRFSSFAALACFELFAFAALPGARAGQIDIGGPAGSGAFGTTVTVLPNGNFVVTDPGYDAPGPITNVGAVYLYDSATLAVISTLTGSTAGDQVGNYGVTVLSNGNYVVLSPYWNGSRGALTWGSGTTGVTGEISAVNSLVGSKANDNVGYDGLTVLNNGNYVVLSAYWNEVRGAVTWGSWASGVTGVVSATNSLVGSTAGDQIGNYGMTILSNGNYVVRSSSWNGRRGAVTWGSGTIGVSGEVSAANSLVGSTANDDVGSDTVTFLNNGNYVVGSPGWNNGRGAVTWASGTTGVTGVVAAANSLVGSTANDYVGFDDGYNGGVTVLINGDYVVHSPYWSGSRGAVTWGSGTTGVTGEISAVNSLVGSKANDNVGYDGLTVLNNGNYVVRSPDWNGYRGAATWGSGTSGVSGEVSASNSLVGSMANDYVGSGGVTVLNNGNYVVRSSSWNGRRGAVTWGSGTIGVSGEVSAANSLVGSTANDDVGNAHVSLLNNGNYVVSSINWNGSRGAVTWCSGTTGMTGVLSAANSLVGSTADDEVGGYNGVLALNNGNYVVNSPYWNGARGAVTWGNGTTGVSGTISAANSLVGNSVSNQVGYNGVTALKNGNYVVCSGAWNAFRGAVTWGDGMSGRMGTVSSANSLVGSAVNDWVGYGYVIPLENGNYVVQSLYWNGYRGAMTWCNSTNGRIGTLSSANSLVGSTANDDVGSGSYYGYNGLIALHNGNYLVVSPHWNGSRGAVTWGSGTSGVSGAVSAANSLVGSAANYQIGYDGATALQYGNYVVSSHYWNGSRGAVTWGSGTSGVSGAVSTANSLVGSTANDQVGSGYVYPLNNGNYVVSSPSWNGLRGAATWGNGTNGVSGAISAANSLVGSTADDEVGGFGVTDFVDGNYVVASPYWDNLGVTNAGAVSLGVGTVGTSSTVSKFNSFRGTVDSGGYSMVFAYDLLNARLLVGYPGDNQVSLFSYGFLPYPEITVEQPTGTNLVDGTAIIGFGSLAVGANSNLTFTIKNTGVASLTGLDITIDGPDAAMFTVTANPVAPVSGPTGSTTFTVLFAPTSAGAKAAALHIANNDPGEDPFDINLTGAANMPPSIATQPQSRTNLVGSLATFTVTVTGTEALLYQWRKGGVALADAGNIAGSGSATLSLANVPLGDAGDYDVVITNNYGAVTSVVAVLTVGELPEITSQPSSRTNLAGTLATFSVTATGTQPLTYHWRKGGIVLADGGNIFGANTATLSLSNVFNDAGDYDVMIANAFGSVTSAVATLTVPLPPAITAQPQDLTVTNGGSGSFGVTASGTFPLGYQWLFNETNLFGETQSNLVLNAVTTNLAGPYSVVVTNTYGSITSSVATLVVLLAPTIEAEPEDLALTNGGSGSFSVTASGTAPLRYQWRWFGTNVANATNATLSFTNTTTNRAGPYSVVITNAAGSITSAVATLTVLSGTSLVQSGDVLAIDPSSGEFIRYRPTDQSFLIITNVGHANSITFDDGAIKGTAWLLSYNLGIIRVNLTNRSFVNFASAQGGIGIAYHSGRLYTTKTSGSKISVYDAATGALLQEFDSANYGLTGGYTGIAFDPEGNRFIMASLNGNRIDAMTTNGVFATLAQAATPGPGTIYMPYHVSYEAPGQFLIGYDDANGSRIQRLTLGALPSVITVASELTSPLVGAPDGSGKIYLGNYGGNGHLRRMNVDGTGLEDLGDPGITGGNLYHVVVVRALGPGQPVLRNATYDAGGHFAFDLMGQPGEQVSVEFFYESDAMGIIAARQNSAIRDYEHTGTQFGNRPATILQDDETIGACRSRTRRIFETSRQGMGARWESRFAEAVR